MDKIQPEAQTKAEKFLKDTYPTFKTTKWINLLRLREPRYFPYENNARLQKEVTEDVIQIFKELNGFIYYLEPSYRMKIFKDSAFVNFIQQEYLNMKEKKSKKKDKNEIDTGKLYAYQTYLNFFNIGLEGLFKTIPDEFKDEWVSQIRPMFKLMQSISKLSTRLTGDKDIPYIYTPRFLEDYIPVSTLS